MMQGNHNRASSCCGRAGGDEKVKIEVTGDD